MTSRFVPHRDRRRLAVAWGLAAVLGSAHAFAQEQVELAWEAPAECPQEAAVRQKLRSLAGDAWRTTERVKASGRIERIDGRYRLTVSVRDGEAAKSRTIEAESCVDLAGAAAVTLGLLLGHGAPGADTGAAAAGGSGAPTTNGSGTEARGGEGDANARASGAGAAGAKQGSDSKAAKPGTPEPTADDAHTDSSSSSSSSDARRLHALLRAPTLTLDLARLPKPSLGFGGGVGLRYAEWRVVASGRILFDQTLWSEDFPDVGSRVSRFAAEASVCRGFRNDSFELAPCLTVGLDHLTARGTGPPNIVRHSQRATSFLLGGAAVAHYYLADWMAVFAGAGVAVATSRPTLTVEGLGEVGHIGAVQVSIGIGPEWIF